jgi:TonB family protein
MKFLASLPLPSVLQNLSHSRRAPFLPKSIMATVLIGLFWTLTASTTAHGQQTPAPAPPTAAPLAAETGKSQSGEITEDELKQLLVGKQLFLRGGYLGDSLSFSEHGLPVGHPTVGSFALSGVEIEKVRLTRHKVQLEGARYALHFLGALPYEDTSKAVDRIRITPKKKVLRITIDREQIVKEKKSKEEKKTGKAAKPSKAGASPAELVKEDIASSETDVAPPTQPTVAPAPAKPATEAASQAPLATESASTPVPVQASEDAADKPADQASVTSTTSPIHAARMLREALDRIFATSLDEKLKAQMPDFWQLYYRAQAAGVDYRPHDPSVLRSSAVDQQAKVLTSITPDSNEFAQASGIAGQALYRVVIGTDGKPAEIAVERPIGFGLDENAVAAIRKATFQPALKAGQPVAETLDLAVLFRIYSKRTSVAGTPDAKPADPLKPGPYTVNAPQAKPQ